MAKRFIATSFMAVCLATTAIASYSVRADEPELAFHPKSKWTIEYIGESKTETLRSCAISNQLNNGYILQLAGTPKGFTNLNIDFRQGSFEKNVKYEVHYSVPGLIDKTIPTKAFKNSLLVSDLRKEQKFSDALQTASVLDIKIRDTEFRVYMTGFQAAMEEYSACITPPETLASSASIVEEHTIKEDIIPRQPEAVEGALAPAPPLDLSAMDSPVPMPSQAAMDEEISAPAQILSPELTERERYTEKLAKQMQEAEKQMDGPPAPVHADIMTPPPPEPVQQKPEIIIKTPEKESAAPAPEEKEAQVETIKESGAIYKIEKSKTIVADFTQPEEKPDPIEAEPTQTLAEEATPPTPAPITPVTDHSEIEAVSASVAEPASGDYRNEDFILMRNKISELEDQVEVLMKKNTLLDEELKISLQDAEKERMTVSSDNWNLEKATMKFNEAERQIMRLGRQLQTSRAQCEQEKAGLENMLFDPSLTNQQQLSSLASLEADLDAAQSELYRQQRQYEERIKILEERLGKTSP